MVNTLTAAKGNGTSMVSVIIPPKDEISRSTKMLKEEMGGSFVYEVAHDLVVCVWVPSHRPCSA